MIGNTRLVKNGKIQIGIHLTTQSSAGFQVKSYDGKQVMVQFGQDQKPGYQYVAREDLFELADVFITLALEMPEAKIVKPIRQKQVYAPKIPEELLNLMRQNAAIIGAGNILGEDEAALPAEGNYAADF